MKFKNYIKSPSIKLLNENVEKSIVDAIHNDKVRRAFFDFLRLIDDENFVLIGGLALGCWGVSRETDDIDIAILSENDINDVAQKTKSKFKRTRAHALEHKTIGVEIEFITSTHIKVSIDLIKKTIQHAKIEDINGRRFKIARPKYLIALKLGRAMDKNDLIKGYRDKSDILGLTDNYGRFDLKGLVPTEQIKFYENLIKDLK